MRCSSFSGLPTDKPDAAMYYLADFKTKERVRPTNLVFTGEANTPWEVIMDFAELASKINIDYFRKSLARS